MKNVVWRPKKQTKSQLRVNIWAGLAYTASIGSYTLLGVVLFRYFIGQSILSRPATNSGAAVVATPPDVSTQLLSTLFGYGITAVIVVLSAVILAILPYLLSRYYARALRRILGFFSLPVSLRNLFYAKVIAVVLPLIGFILLAFIDPLFDKVFIVCYLLSVGLVLLAELFLYIQLRLIRRSKIATKQIW